MFESIKMKFIRLAALPVAVVAVLAFRPALADGDAKATVDTLDSALLDVMKNATKLGYKGRYDKLTPVLEKTYDMPLMARISVGPQWASLSPDDQAKIIAAFKTLSIATYASRFDGYGGEQFQVTGGAPTTGGDEVVNTKLLRPKDDAIDLNYRLRKDGADWKIIDVFLSGTISQLANYRSEFAATLRSGGADALVGLIDQKVAALTPK
jgi:phospholipid transport system substrate-binding protein